MYVDKNHSKSNQVSIIIPTYNESKNIIQILKSIGENLPKEMFTQAIVVDDNSPDGTGKIVEDYRNTLKKMKNFTIDIIHRKAKSGLASAIVNGIQHAQGETIIVMDSDFSHPPQIIPKLVNTLKQYRCDIVIASRYIKGGKIQGWSFKRQLMSKIATTIAKKGLKINSYDPMSGFFAFKRNIIDGLSLDAIGYKILLEILVKTKNVKIHEIPYVFSNRKFGTSKVDTSTIIDYFNSVYKLYRFGKLNRPKETRNSIHFLSKAARFFTVGLSGFGVNYLFSFLFTIGLFDMWYLHANVVGIFAAMSSNFILNKIWTFEDKDFSIKKTLTQYAKFGLFSSIGAVIQLSIVFSLVDTYQFMYPTALIIGVVIGAFGNFVLNKKLTFKEKLWNNND